MLKTNRIDRTNFKSNNYKAFTSLIVPLVIVGLGLYLTSLNHLLTYIIGQLLISIFFLQTFILLHECGHLNFFKQKFLNDFFGNVFGVLTMIPFYNWKHMHNLHHKWTGWRDKDPTTEKTVEPSESHIMRIVANVSWFLFLPIFYLAYKLSNYWNLLKVKRHLNSDKYSKAVYNVIIYILFYSLVVYFFWEFLKSYILPAFILSLIWKELVILTQHSHIEIPVSKLEQVRPVAYKNQVDYTRSFYVNKVIAHYLLFNFNLHELHHVYPGLPAYWMQNVNLDLPQKPKYFEWFFKAKSMKGEDYIFRTSKNTGKYF
jgi:omega-6 fatty acid desaturase (delta-12 desaturase)